MLTFLWIYLMLVQAVPGAVSGNSFSTDGVVLVSRREVLDLSTDGCDFSGTIHLGGPFSLVPQDKYFALGSKQLISYQMVTDYVNRYRCGVKLQDRNYRIELQSYDDRSSVDSTYKIAKYLVNNDSTDIILGGYSSETTEPLANVTSASGRLMIAPGASTTSVFANRPKTFGVAPPTPKYTAEAVKAMALVAGARSIATVYEDVAFTRGACGAVPQLAQQYGLNVTSQHLVVASPNVSILEPVARNISKENPDVVVTCTYDGGCENWIQAMKNVRWSPKAQIFTVCVGLQEFVDNAGPDVPYVFGIAPWDQSLPTVDPVTGWNASDFANTFRLITGDKDITYQAAQAAAVMSILVQSIEAVQTLDETILANYIANSSFSTVYGNIQFDANGQSKAPIVLLQYDSTSTLHSVYPPQISSRTLVYPMPTWDQRACELNSTCKVQGNSCNQLGLCVCVNPNQYSVGFGASALCVPKEEMNYISVPILGSLYFMVAVNCSLCCLAAFWTFYYRNNKLVHASQPVCLHLIICGSMLSTLAIIPLTYQTGYEDSADIRRADAACMAVPWMWGLGFIITFSSLFAKIWRVKKLFQSAAGMRRQKVGMELVFYILMGMGIIEIAILIAFQVVSPLEWYREILDQVNGYVVESQGYCSSQEGWWFFLALGGFNVICLVYAVILSFQTKDIPSIFAEGKQIFLAVMLMLQVLILAIPLSALVRNDPTNFCFIRGMSIFLQNFTVLVAIFAPKMMMIYRGVDTEEAVRVAIAEGVARARLSRNTTIYRPSAVTAVSNVMNSTKVERALSMITSEVRESIKVEAAPSDTRTPSTDGMKMDEVRSERKIPSNVSARIRPEELVSDKGIPSNTSNVVQEERKFPSQSSDDVTGDMYQ